MTEEFKTRRTSLAPIAAALAGATSEYAERRQEVEDAHVDLCSARLGNANWGPAPRNAKQLADAGRCLQRAATLGNEELMGSNKIQQAILGDNTVR